MAPGREQAVADLGLHHSPSQEAPEPKNWVTKFRPHQSTTEPHPQMIHSKAKLGRNQSPTKGNPVPYGQPLYSGSSTVVAASSHNQWEGQSLPLTCQWQSRLDYNRGVHTIHTRNTLEASVSGDQGDCSVGPQGSPTT